MKNIIIHIHNINDLNKIDNNTKYINLDINSYNPDIINYFINNGVNYLYSDMINDNPGYTYATYDAFLRGEEIINNICSNVPRGLSSIEIAKYLYISLGKLVYYDINSDNFKNDNYTLINNVCNLWESLGTFKVNDISIAKIYYYMCNRLNIKNKIVNVGNNITNELYLDNQIVNVNLFKDLPFIQTNMKTRYFGSYNDDIILDKNILYLNNRYNDYYIDIALKNINYLKDDCIYTFLNRSMKLFNIDKIQPTSLSIVYDYLFKKYFPNYEIIINNLYLNCNGRLHFILISYHNNHYSYNYQKKCFIKVNDSDIINNVNLGKIGIYLNESIPNISNI